MLNRPIDHLLSRLNHIHKALREQRFKYHVDKDENHLIDASSFLRLFYCDKGRGGKSILKQIQESYKFNFYVYHEPGLFEHFENEGDLELVDTLRSGAVFVMENSNLTWFLSGSEFIPLLEAIEKEILFVSHHSFSPKKIIEVVCEKKGGAHFDPKVSNEELALDESWAWFGDKDQTIHFLLMIISNTILVIDQIESHIIWKMSTKNIVNQHDE